MSGMRVGIVGATGQVGQVVLELLEQRNYPLARAAAVRFSSLCRSAD